MTQRNIDIMNLIVDEVVAGKKISEALATVYVKRNVVIPNYESIIDVPTLKLGLGNRVTNALMRKGLKTVGEIVEFSKTNSWKTVQGFGESSGLVLMETLLNFAWDKMDEEERFEFLVDAVERNEENLRA